MPFAVMLKPRGSGTPPLSKEQKTERLLLSRELERIRGLKSIEDAVAAHAKLDPSIQKLTFPTEYLCI